MSLSDKVIVVTGAASGMGRTTALMLAERGAHLGLLDLAIPDELLSELKSFSVQAIPLPCDVRDSKAVDEAIRKVAETIGPIHGAANLAGVLGPGKQPGISDNSLLEMSDEEWNRVVDINLTGLKNCLRSELRYRNPSGCSIINGASVSGQLGNPYNSAYGASKGAVIALTFSVAGEMGHLGVRINAIAPGVTATPMLNNVSESTREAWAKKNTFGRPGTPEEIANMIIFLLSDDASFCHGSVFNVDGGRV